MSQTNDFEKTNLGWQFKQFTQQVDEWIEARIFPSIGKALSGLEIPDWLGSLLTWLSWIGLGLLSAWFLWQLWLILYPYFRGWLATGLASGSERSTPQAPLTNHSVEEWLKRSQEFQRQGNYTEACRVLYMAMLQSLNDAKVIPHQLSRTDAEYLQMLTKLPQMQSCRVLIEMHERLCFAGQEISAAEFSNCQQAYQAINYQINSQAKA